MHFLKWVGNIVEVCKPMKHTKKLFNKKKEIAPLATKPIEGKDYYLENDLIVMTEAYHLKRGYCCGNKCRHCPYTHKNVPK